MAKGKGSKQKIREFLLANIGRVVTALEIREASGGVNEWARRLRELRDEEGWKIKSHNDLADLAPGEYQLLEVPKPISITFSRSISAKLRAEVFDRNGFTCQSCGATPGDTDEVTGRNVRLHVGHVMDKSLGGLDELSNLRTLCSSCNQGAKNVTQEKPTGKWLLAQVRRASVQEQEAVLLWLMGKFPKKVKAALEGLHEDSGVNE